MGQTTPIFSPTGGMKISATGLAKYMIMHARNGAYDGGNIISKKSSIQMQTKLSDEGNYGLALRISDKLIATLMLFFFSSLSNNSANFFVSRECIYEKISSASLILFDCSLPTK